MDTAAFAEKAKAYCDITKGSVTSWGRTPTHNRAVGGVPDSKHIHFLAVDVVHDHPIPPAETRQQIADMVGLRLIIESDHDHLEDPAPV